MDVRNKILSAAAKLFKARGIQASGVDSIILEAGIAKSTLYKHFPSKNLLVIAYLNEQSDLFYTWMNNKLGAEAAKPSDVLIQFCEFAEQWIMNPEHDNLPFYVTSSEFPDPTHPINQCSSKLFDQLENYICNLATNAGASNPRMISRQIAILFIGATSIEKLMPECGALACVMKTVLLLP